MAFQTGAADRQATEKPFNNLLRMLREQDYALIYNPGDNVDLVYFPCGSTLVSFLVSNEDGRDVETILVGREGAVGGIVSHGKPERSDLARSARASRVAAGALSYEARVL